jgi:hypothetical protein
LEASASTTALTSVFGAAGVIDNGTLLLSNLLANSGGTGVSVSNNISGAG